MSSLYATIKQWSDGQNSLNDQPIEQRDLLQHAVDRLVNLLQEYASLLEMAGAFHSDEGTRARRVSEEFTASTADANLVLASSYWQRFMQIRDKQRGTARRQ